MRHDQPHKTDGVRMLGLCAALEISMSEIEGDARAFQQVLAFDERASKADELAERSRRLGAEVRKEKALVRPACAQRYEPELRDLIQRQATAVHKLGLARAAETSAAKLRTKHPRVFGPTADEASDDVTRRGG